MFDVFALGAVIWTIISINQNCCRCNFLFFSTHPKLVALQWCSREENTAWIMDHECSEKKSSVITLISLIQLPVLQSMTDSWASVLLKVVPSSQWGAGQTESCHACVWWGVELIFSNLLIMLLHAGFKESLLPEISRGLRGCAQTDGSKNR